MKLRDLNKITVNIPTLNEEKNIIDCIKSVKKSGIKKIIVIDGGSTDKTIKLIKSQKVKLIRVEKKGLAYQRGIGIKNTYTKYVALIDADHRTTKNSFLKLLNDLNKSDYASVQAVLRSKNKRQNYFEKCYQAITDINVNFSGPTNMIGMPTLWKTKIIKKHNFDPKFTAGSDDTDLSYRISNKGYIFGHSSAIIYNIHRTSLKQYIKKYMWYGKGDAQFITNHPERSLSMIKHQIFNYPIKYSFISLSKLEFYPIPFMIMAGYLRFIGMIFEFFNLIFKRKEKIYST